MRVTSKAEFFSLSQKLVFGNRLRQWTWQQYLATVGTPEEPARVSVRNTGQAGTVRMQRYRMTRKQAHDHCRMLFRHGYPESMLLLDESAPDDRVQLQCEVMNSSRFIEMRYALNSRGMGMRQAYEIMDHVWGYRAVAILRKYLDEHSIENLFRLLQDYGDSCIELSAYEIPVGVLGWNTIFWEVRDY